MSEKRICVIGAGNWGKNHINTLYKLGALGGIVESDQTHAKEIRMEYPDIQFFTNVDSAMENNFDGFTVATPAETHFQIGRKLLEANYPVLIEKPLALNSIDAEKLVKISEMNNVSLMVGHLLLFHPAIQKIKELITADRIGNLQYIYSNRLNLGTVRAEENVFWSFAPHDISIFQYFLECEPEFVSSKGAAFLQIGIYDTTMTSLSYPENIHGHIFVSWLHPFKEHRLVVVGDKGMIRFEDSLEHKPLKVYEKGIDWIKGIPVNRNGPSELIQYETDLPLKVELNYFINHLDQRPKISNGQNGLEVVKILEDATNSMLGKV